MTSRPDRPLTVGTVQDADPPLLPDELTRNPAAVMLAAADDWAIWHPGDHTQYRVRVIPIAGGPDHADRVLLVNCVGTTIAIQYADPKIAAYRVKPWTRKRWNAARMPTFGGYDAWNVVWPLLSAAEVTA